MKSILEFLYVYFIIIIPSFLFKNGIEFVVDLSYILIELIDRDILIINLDVN